MALETTEYCGVLRKIRKSSDKEAIPVKKKKKKVLDEDTYIEVSFPFVSFVL